MTRLIYISLFLLGNLSAVSQHLSEEVLLSSSSDRNFYAPASHETNGFSTSELDTRAFTIKTKDFNSINELTDQLVKSNDNQYDKVRSIYAWIAGNISYFENTIINQPQTAEAVWSSRKAVCEGYANLFNAICREAGIESRMVKGYVRDISGMELKFPNHAWNSVKIDDKWHLLDVTWASVNNSSEIIGSDLFDEMFQNRKLDFFFLVKPEKMILSHLPEDPYWQLQSKTIDLKTFMKGEEFIIQMLQSHQVSSESNFELLIDDYEKLDSLDRSIAYLERMVENSQNSVKEYGLGIAYYYKAQNILKNNKEFYSPQEVRDRARKYYQKSLEYLSLLQEDDFGYDFSQDLANNVMFRIEVLQ